MKTYCSLLFRKRFTAGLLLLFISYYGANGCIDLQTWCYPNRNFCDNDVMKMNCPSTCNTCLPEECRLKCTQNCTVVGETVECSCYDGYRLQADGGTCEDIDECAENLLTCVGDEVCQNHIGHAECVTNICTPFNKHDFVLSTSFEDKCCKNSARGQCGANNLPNVGQKIISGEDARIEYWPWQALFILGSTEKCGGTLIDDIWIISAAHCFDKYQLNRIADYNITVLLGLNDTTIVTSISMEPRRVVEVLVPDGYVFPVNDIALVRLDRPIARSSFIQPVCLPNGEIPPVGTRCFITGFGTTNAESTVLPRHLQQANVSIVDDEVCRLAYKDFQHPVVPDKMICAGYPNGGIDACRGDSGGPLVCQRCSKCDWYLVGVTSYGRGCAQANAYGVYTEVEKFENWIASKISTIDVSKKTCEPIGWGEWGDWSECTEQCDGSQTRNRKCLNGVRGIPGCIGKDVEERTCTSENQRMWTTWTECSVTCGGGEQVRKRHCMPRGPRTQTERRNCNEQPCVKWSSWSIWSTCPSLCGREERLRTRSCIGGIIGDVDCQGSSRQTERCIPDPSCTKFGPWSEWSACSKTCGGGVRTSSRICSGENFGLTCSGDATKTEPCAIATCGRWSEFSPWTDCNRSCGGGQRTRTRSCEGGNDCVGENIESENCNQQACVSWSDWSQWSSCSTTCGDGNRERTRTCGNGDSNTSQCLGSANNQEQCNLGACVAAFCSEQCKLYVYAGYCIPQYKEWLSNFCGSGCCTETFCRDTWSDCHLHGNVHCTNQRFASVCIKHCGYCS